MNDPINNQSKSKKGLKVLIGGEPSLLHKSVIKAVEENESNLRNLKQKIENIILDNQLLIDAYKNWTDDNHYLAGYNEGTLDMLRLINFKLKKLL